MEHYAAYLLDDTSREKLLIKYPPKYSKVIGHHITVKYGVPVSSTPPEPAKAKVVGYADSGDGIEALVVSVNGTTERPDGNLYHITWSLDPEKYSPKDSNTLLSQKGYKNFKVVLPTPISITPGIF